MKRLIFVLGASALILSACGGGGSSQEVTGAEEFGYQPLPAEETTIGAGAVAATVGAAETLAEEEIASATITPEEPVTEAVLEETTQAAGAVVAEIGGGSDAWFHAPGYVTLDYHSDGVDYWDFKGTDAGNIQSAALAVGAEQDYVDVVNHKSDAITYANGKSSPAVAYTFSVGGSTWYAVEVHDTGFDSYQYVCFADDELRCISISYKGLKQVSEDEIQKSLEDWFG